MADDLTPRPGESQDPFEKAREVLDGISQYQIDPRRIKLSETEPRAKGGQGTILIGTIIPPEEVATWVPEQPLERILDLKYAIKKLKWECEDAEKWVKDFKSFVNEASLMARLSHPNIVKLVGYVEDMQKMDAWIVLPWEANGNVKEFLQSGEWDIPERISLIKDVVNGVEYLHSREPPICHGDLKSLNILVNSSYRAVITDFGSARIQLCVGAAEKDSVSEVPRPAVDDDEAERLTSPKINMNGTTLELTLTDPGFSLRWTAPEVLDNGVQDISSDMWAVGWICWEIVTGKLPFEELLTQEPIINRVVKGELPAARDNSQLSQVVALCSLMSDCWVSNPAMRMKACTFQQKARHIPSTVPSNTTSGGAKVRSAALLYQLGTMHRLQDDVELAESSYRSAADVAFGTKDHRAEANALIGLGETYRGRWKFQKAEEAFRRAHEIYSDIGSEMGVANALHGLGEVYRARSRYQEAEKALRQTYEIHSRIGNDMGAASALNHLGEIYHGRSRYQEAEEALRQAHEIHSRIGNDMGAANALDSLGQVYSARSRYQEAKEAFREAREIQSRIGSDLGVANALNGLGQIYCAQSRYQEAEEAFSEAHEIHSRICNLRGSATALLGLGKTYGAQSKHQEAEKAFNAAAEIYSRHDDNARTGKVFYSLGILFHDQCRYTEMETSYRNAIAAFERAGQGHSKATTLLALGVVQVSQRRYFEAEEAVTEALAIWINLESEHGQLCASALLSHILGSQSKHAEKVDALIRAHTLLARIPHDNVFIWRGDD